MSALTLPRPLASLFLPPTVAPARGGLPLGQRYRPRTMTVETRWSGLTVTDFLDEAPVAGSNGDPTFAELMGPGVGFPVPPWTKYCEAFA